VSQETSAKLRVVVYWLILCDRCSIIMGENISLIEFWWVEGEENQRNLLII
jgi:hypothetical protein